MKITARNKLTGTAVDGEGATTSHIRIAKGKRATVVIGPSDVLVAMD
jgi:molybdopterin-binding protein